MKLDYLITGAGLVVALFIAYMTLVWVPVALMAEAECLRKGYPQTSVTVGLERYCLTLDGAVTVKVDGQ